MDNEEPRNLGNCALCGERRILRNSHLIPQWVYGRLQQTDQGRDHPIEISNGSAVQTSREVKKYLLCEECEQRFSKREDYVSGLTRVGADGTLHILSNVTRPYLGQAHVGLLNSEIDINAIVYFAASIIWRGHVMFGNCKLGKYEEAFRRYLMGEMRFPSEASLSMVILESSDRLRRADGYSTIPSSMKIPCGWLHGFAACGLIFRCYVGGSLEPGLKVENLAADTSAKRVLVRKPEYLADFHEVQKATAAATPRGKLASRGSRKQ